MPTTRPAMLFRLPHHLAEDYPGSVPIPQHVVHLLHSRIADGSPWECRPYITKYGRIGPSYRLLQWTVQRRVYTLPAHRLALMLRLDRPLKPGMHACHACNNKKCINAFHVYEGTPQDNADDRKRFSATKGRVIAIRRQTHRVTCEAA